LDFVHTVNQQLILKYLMVLFLVCVLCDGTVKQYVNGSIKYEKVDTTILTGGVYPIIPEEDEDDF
jgi:hypothetical protein